MPSGTRPRRATAGWRRPPPARPAPSGRRRRTWRRRSAVDLAEDLLVGDLVAAVQAGEGQVLLGPGLGPGPRRGHPGAGLGHGLGEAAGRVRVLGPLGTAQALPVTKVLEL